VKRIKPPPGGFLMGGPPDRVATGWRYGIRWLFLSVQKGSVRIHEAEIIQRQKGAYQG
jgi:hypothetical protein